MSVSSCKGAEGALHEGVLEGMEQKPVQGPRKQCKNGIVKPTGIREKQKNGGGKNTK